MKFYTVTGRTAGFGAGQRLKLTRAQVDSRAHRLTLVDEKKGVYEATAPIEFKKGEAFGFDGDLPKTIAVLVEETKGGAKDASAPSTEGLHSPRSKKGKKRFFGGAGPAASTEEAPPAEGDKAA